MPQQRMDIRMIKDILRLKYSGGLSHEAHRAQPVASPRASSPSTSAWPGPPAWTGTASADLDEAALERRLLGRSSAETAVVEPDFARVHVELRRKGVTLMLLWQEYRAAHEGRRTWAYTQFCEHYKALRQDAQALDAPAPARRREAVHRLRRPDAGAGRWHRARQVFVAAMGASSYTFACATADQSMRSWLGAMARALTLLRRRARN